jgi:hypothetical protein
MSADPHEMFPEICVSIYKGDVSSEKGSLQPSEIYIGATCAIMTMLALQLLEPSIDTAEVYPTEEGNVCRIESNKKKREVQRNYIP